MIHLKHKKRVLNSLIIFIFGICIFILGLGSTGLVDETPPLFAAAGRAMSESGDWLTPKVNGIFRFDKPPLIYWIMGFFYSLPKNEVWDTLGTLSARLPSAVASLSLMVLVGDTIYCWPHKFNRNIFAPIVASLGFALSPLVIIWSRTAVSDALLCGTLGISLLLFWRRFASDQNEKCILPWFFLGLATLTKGPVALILATMTITSFLITQKNWKNLLKKINLKLGFLITFLISSPWYCILLLKEGKPFWDSFFGYHNFQRYTSVVNNHSEPIWFFILIMIIGSLPFTPFLFHGIFEAFKDLAISFKKFLKPSETIFIYCLCWLGSVLIFFSISATKLPSYWLPATPAAAILVSNSFIKLNDQSRKFSYLWVVSFLIFFGLSISLFFSNIWLSWINDPEMPNLANNLLNSGIISTAKVYFILLSIISLILSLLRNKNTLFYIQIIVYVGQLFLMPPIRMLADNTRQLPLRNVSKLIINVRKGEEILAMVGIRKPSLHYYTKQIVFYEPSSKEGLINLSERLNFDRRKNYQDEPDYDYQSLLVVIDKYSFNEEHWRNINHQTIGQYGIYKLLRIQKSDLNKYSKFLVEIGYKSNWRYRKVERF